MSGTKAFRSCSPDMPPSPGHWLLARIVLELIRELDLSAVERPIQSKSRRDEVTGAGASHPDQDGRGGTGRGTGTGTGWGGARRS